VKLVEANAIVLQAKDAVLVVNMKAELTPESFDAIVEELRAAAEFEPATEGQKFEQKMQRKTGYRF
jgi:hypothetical protein